MLKFIVALVLIPFTVLSMASLWQVGYWALFTQQFANFGTQQVLADLLIAVGICMYWMWRDAQNTGRNPWPWLALSMVSGSFGPLLYFITAKKRVQIPQNI
ncbi:MAG: DUF2834 domain-containing protein [Polaromonas sp.]|uniref:DUF2834 domain-containing protein n=1 Tax=Polaromonas sp. TaxID=1869339 RepID=UPI0027365E5C|nr:DUF2834 domain-containing protein [Polaromonas sp.]MDP2820205.1 DUF2834 domain-containing protein [Polaromonas sp.]